MLLEKNDLLAISDQHKMILPEEDNNKLICITPVSVNLQRQEPVLMSKIVQRQTTPRLKYDLIVGKEFPDVTSCRKALRETAIALKFEIKKVKSDKNRFTAKCASEGCPWRIHTAKLPGVPTFTIRTINSEHNCGGISHLGHKQASVEWVANMVEKGIKENPQCKTKDILENIHCSHGITLSYNQAWRGKERVMAAVRASFEEEYRILPQFCNEVKLTNPKSIVSVYVNPEDKCFQCLFIALQASIHGFLNACRPLVGIDRIVLKNKYLGTLLFATGFDGDGALFPLAFGVVEEANEENSMWFISELHNLIEVNTENMPMLTILSNRHKHVVDGVSANFPTAFHGLCMRHLSDNFRKEFNNIMLVNILWDAAKALTIMEFESKIHAIEEISQEAANWIKQIPASLWATAYFEGTRFGQLTANIDEPLNVLILEASELPIIQMMKCICKQLMMLFNERREKSMQWNTILVPNAGERVSESIKCAQKYQVVGTNEAEFKVISDGGTSIIDIRKRICLCRGWQLYGIPCSHAVAALLSCRQNVHRYTESCFTVATYKKAYSQIINLVPNKKKLERNVRFICTR